MKRLLNFKAYEASNQNPGSSYASYMRNNYHQGSGEESSISRKISDDWAMRKAMNPVDRAQDKYYFKCKNRLEKKLGRTATDSEVTAEFDKGWMKHRAKLVRAEQLEMEGRTKNWQKSDKLHDINKKTGMFESFKSLQYEIEEVKKDLASSGGRKYTYEEAAHTPMNLDDVWQSYTDPEDAEQFIEELNKLPIIELENITLDDLSLENDYKTYNYPTALVKIGNNWFICFSEGYDYWRYIYGVSNVEDVVENIDFKIASQKELKGFEKTGVFN